MSCLKTIVLSIISSFFLITTSMDRPPKRSRDDYKESAHYKRYPQKKSFDLPPYLIQHGAYLATVQNKSSKDLRIANVPLQAKKTRHVKNNPFASNDNEANDGDFIEFSTDEDNAKDIDTVAQNQNLSTNRLVVAPTTASEDLSTAEAFCFLVEATKEPTTRKLLWVLRSIDDEERTCEVVSYFDHETGKKSYTSGIKKYDVRSKVITLINLVVSDPELKDIQARVKSFAVSGS